MKVSFNSETKFVTYQLATTFLIHNSDVIIKKKQNLVSNLRFLINEDNFHAIKPIWFGKNQCLLHD